MLCFDQKTDENIEIARGPKLYDPTIPKNMAIVRRAKAEASLAFGIKYPADRSWQKSQVASRRHVHPCKSTLAPVVIVSRRPIDVGEIGQSWRHDGTPT